LSLRIGNGQLNNLFTDGLFDDVRYYNRALTAQEIDSLAGIPETNSLLGGGDLYAESYADRSVNKKYILKNYPNPFHNFTTIEFAAPETKKMRLIVYNSLGQQISTLFNGIAERDRHYLLTFDGNRHPEGLYYYRLVSDDELIGYQKMMLVK
jgi:hypothetical protein